MIGYLGESVTFSCSYPEEFKTNDKFFYKQRTNLFTEVIRTSDQQRGRFSISDDQSSKVVSVTLRDVEEDDGGVYFCGVGSSGKWLSYESLSTEIQLQVTGENLHFIV